MKSLNEYVNEKLKVNKDMKYFDDIDDAKELYLLRIYNDQSFSSYKSVSVDILDVIELKKLEGLEYELTAKFYSYDSHFTKHKLDRYDNILYGIVHNNNFDIILGVSYKEPLKKLIKEVVDYIRDEKDKILVLTLDELLDRLGIDDSGFIPSKCRTNNDYEICASQNDIKIENIFKRLNR